LKCQNEKVFSFFESVLDEIIELFDSEYVHAVGDEAPSDSWWRCPKYQAQVEKLGLKATSELQRYFTEHFGKYLLSRGRHLMGWDEIIDSGLPDGAAVMSWHGAVRGQKAVAMCHKVVIYPSSHFYLDHAQFLWDDGYEFILEVCHHFTAFTIIIQLKELQKRKENL
jgi:hexosaminidase